MPEAYAELYLYFGLCPQDGRGEGRFDPNAESVWERRRYFGAIENIERYLGRDWGVRIGGIDPLARSEVDAKLLINHAMVNIPRSRGLVTPVDAMHWSVRFWRKIRFDGATPDQRGAILQEMQRSGHQPYTREQLRRDGYSDHKFFLSRNQEIWEKALVSSS
ncbi:hypothetical protein HY383_03870 [Candidatus Daviesbacteria bacterium]|nr:hypothetical protein [Candidatus Daviesbacteria bacterium]